MRMINNFSGEDLIDTLFIFESKEEREDFFSLSYEGAQRNHKQNLQELKRQYLESLQADSSSASYHLEIYRDRIKKQYESYYRDLANIRKQKQESRLESDLSAPAGNFLLSGTS